MTGPTPLPPLVAEEYQRYQRHLVLPEIGADGQRRLKAAKVLLIGAGGLGSPLALYLAAAGIGTLGMVDFDVVDLSNLQRQVLHGTANVGRPKLVSAQAAVAAINPHVKFVPHATRLAADNALELLRPYDLIIDGTDNFGTRYLVNDACVLLGKPNVYGSVLRFEGQASVFAYPGGPCYRCLFPEPPPPGTVPDCAAGGVLGVLPGLIGLIQATEALKLLLGIGSPLVGRLLLYHALEMRFRELTLRRDPQCPVCGDQPRITQLHEYSGYCQMPSPTVKEISPIELKRRLDQGEALVLVDVREDSEWEVCKIAGAQHIPLATVPGRLAELPRDQEIVVYCKLGGRSARAAQFLASQGFTRLHNLTGGIFAWIDQVDATQRKY